MTLVAGVADTLRVRLQNETKDILTFSPHERYLGVSDVAGDRNWHMFLAVDEHASFHGDEADVAHRRLCQCAVL